MSKTALIWLSLNGWSDCFVLLYGKGKKNLLAVSVFIRLFTESVEIELINISIRHMLGPYATRTHF